MSEDWFDHNNRYLAATLEWLRAKLEHFASESARSSMDELSPLQRWLGKESRPTQSDIVASAALAREAADGPGGPVALTLLAQRFGLSEFERDTLMLCAALDLDPNVAPLCARALGSPSRTYPTFGLALSMLDEPAWDALSPHRPLRFARMIDINMPPGTALTAAALRADERIVNYLKGVNTIDDRLSVLIRPSGPPLALSETQSAVGARVVAQLKRAAETATLPIVQLVGVDDACRMGVAQEVAEAIGRKLYRLDAGTLPTAAADIEQTARLWQRETVMLPVALYIDGGRAESGETAAALARFLEREAGVVFLGVGETPLSMARLTVPFDVAMPTPAEQYAEWAASIAGQEPEIKKTAALLAGQFSLNLGEIREAARSISSEPLSQKLWRVCRDMSRPRLDQLAQRLDAKATWDNLVLPDEQMKLMRQIAGQVRARHRVYTEWGFAKSMNRGFGINALFAGETGTGKTMGAEVLANDLDLNLYRIDLSAVVSKYIGETEKNLRRLFDAAEQGGAILFFDEADALFGKRSEVRDSHDRYANIEINYLLQRIESFSGLSILATNMRSALDVAFLRRLRFVVNFPFPSAKERRAIWERAWPPQVPRDGLDYDRLARMNLSGGNIHSIALNAAFSAAQNGQKITMSVIVAAARMELRKLERPFNEAEFR
jgi:SpoVK/Ycf46/Vps4 family AAA+-type ATPase